MDNQVEFIKGPAPIGKLLKELHITAVLVQLGTAHKPAVADAPLDNFLSKHHEFGIIMFGVVIKYG